MAEENKDLQQQNQNIDIQAEIEKARKQERDKLHADIERLKTEIADKAKTCNENYITIADLQKQLKAKEKDTADVEAKITKAKEEGKMESKADFEKLQKELEDTKAALEKAQKEFADYKANEEVVKYLNEKLADIEEDFKELVVGTSKEEIDASYTKAKALQDKVKAKYSDKKAPLPDPKDKGFKAKSVEDLVKKISSMSDEEYRNFRKGKK